MKILLIDDIRDPSFILDKYGKDPTHIARTFKQGINLLKNSGPFDLLLLDHDLSSFDEEGNELTGYKIMLFLEENTHLLPKQIILVTDNPVGRAKMKTVIDKLYNKGE